MFPPSPGVVPGLRQPGVLFAERLSGGSVKGVYRVWLDDGGTALAYRWHPDENYWPTDVAIDVAPFGGPGGQDVFLRKHERLTSLGVRVPRLLFVVTGLVFVEDLRGGTLEALLARDPAAGRQAMGRLREMLLWMHSYRVPARIDAPGAAVERGRRALAEAVARVPRIAAEQTRLAYALSERHRAIHPRPDHGVIHGELGPDHVMIADDGEPVLIDIEGTMAFDVEWEHAFLELRFGTDYPLLHTIPLDEARMRLYRLVHYLSLVAGPLQLLDTDFPNRDFMQGIVTHNVEKTLSEIG